ncbi:MAG: NIPSNAP family protein [Gammaproteobacteria bacterium]|nr:NIPSNAP family protein [Gammaproteobacteria bacterium]
MNKLIKTSTISLVSLAIGLGAGIFFSSAAQDEKVFELRTYTATPGNLDNLHARFRDHTTRIFRKHGMEVVGYWSPTSEEEREDTLVYLLAHDNQDAANASWQAFIADSEWATVAEESNRNGQILGGIEAKFMVATDYSPMK